MNKLAMHVLAAPFLVAVMASCAKADTTSDQLDAKSNLADSDGAAETSSNLEYDDREIEDIDYESPRRVIDIIEIGEEEANILRDILGVDREIIVNEHAPALILEIPQIDESGEVGVVIKYSKALRSRTNCLRAYERIHTWHHPSTNQRRVHIWCQRHNRTQAEWSEKRRRRLMSDYYWFGDDKKWYGHGAHRRRCYTKDGDDVMIPNPRLNAGIFNHLCGATKLPRK